MTCVSPSPQARVNKENGESLAPSVALGGPQPSLPRQNYSPENLATPVDHPSARTSAPRTRARDSRSNNACLGLRMFVGLLNRRGSKLFSVEQSWRARADRLPPNAEWRSGALRCRSRMASGAMGVSMQPERRPVIERGLRDPREHRRRVAETRDASASLLRLAAPSMRQESRAGVFDPIASGCARRPPRRPAPRCRAPSPDRSGAPAPAAESRGCSR